jgi:cytochrome c-type biogenesis protein CcmH
MILWLVLGLMTATAIFAVIGPLFRRGIATRSGSDIAVYRDQLDELDRDLASGLIGRNEADAARVEISRRLLATADAAQAGPVAASSAAVAWRQHAVLLAAIVLLPAGAVGLYLQLGSPELATATVAAERNAPAGQQLSVEAMVASVEAHLQRNPKDGRGWEVLAPVYMRLGRYTDSANAWRNALQLLGDDADREANLGESLTSEANGIVTADAKAAFVRAVTLDSTSVTARYYLGIAAEQDGDREKAAKIMRQLIADAPAGAHWVSDVRTALARLEGKAPAPPAGPTPEQAAAIAKQPPEQQSAMIRSMVDRLATRLKENSADPDGWIRLVRSYKVLGEADKAQSAIADAQRALAGDADKLQRFNAALTTMDGGAAPAPAAPAPEANATPLPQAAAPPDHGQDAMIQDMVDRLAARLKTSALDPQGWVMLTRSYLTLGQKDKATAAIKDARSALATDPGKLVQFNEALTQFKIGE